VNTYDTARAGFCPHEFVNVTGPVLVAYPTDACKELTNGDYLTGAIVIVDVGLCSNQEKVRTLQRYGALVSKFNSNKLCIRKKDTFF